MHPKPRIVPGSVPGSDLGSGNEMARSLSQLTAKSAGALSEPGRHPDGGGLFLQVKDAKGSEGRSRAWVFIYRSPIHRTERKAKDGAIKKVGQTREMGLGPFGDGKDGSITLAMARDKAADARKLIAAGKDPLDERRRAAEPVRTVPTFGEMADQLIAAMAPSWSNDKHVYQWRHTLTEYAAPLRSKPVNEVTVADVLECLKPHWERRPETAARLRGRIERVLNAAKAQGFRTGENPAAWRGHLENLLPKRQRLTRGHQAAMPWERVPEFVADLRKRDGMTALALEFLILTATRSRETREAPWSEIDLVAKVWTIPAPRMKRRKLHRVPLTPRMIEILETVKPLRRDDEFVFPGQIDGRPLSDMAFKGLYTSMTALKITAHGFRSSFRDWAGDKGYSREIAEETLAHAVGNAVERAYRRSDALEQRRKLMEVWERFCAGQSNVVDLTARRVAG